MILPEEFGYIAGMVDGEGHITFFQKKDRYSSMHVGITNTNMEIINKCVGIMERLGCNPKLYFSNPNPKKWKERCVILLTNQDDCYRFLLSVTPYLCGKKSRAELAMRYIESRRLSRGKSPSGNGRNIALSEDEISMVNEMRKLNKRGVS